MLKIREFLRKARGFWGEQYVQHSLKVSKTKSLKKISSLEKLGYIQKTSDNIVKSRDMGWEITLKGRTLSLACAAKPILRKNAT